MICNKCKKTIKNLGWNGSRVKLCSDCSHGYMVVKEEVDTPNRILDIMCIGVNGLHTCKYHPDKHYTKKYKMLQHCINHHSDYIKESLDLLYDDIPPCPSGKDCYRKNPQHFKDYHHNF